MFKFYYILTYPLTLLALLPLWLYRKVFTFGKAKSCKFIPTCSAYAWASILEFGAVLGGILTVKRILKCRANHPAGIDMPKLNIYGNYKWKC